MSDLETPDRRHAYREFDPSLIESFLAGREISGVELIPTGKSNTNFKLTLSDGLMVVLRLFSDVGMNSPERESRIAQLVGGRVPIPAIFDLGEDWVLSEFAPGEMLESSPEGVGAAAEALARLSEISFEASGWIQADGVVTPFDFGDDYVEMKLAEPEVVGWVGSDRVNAVQEILRREAGRLSEVRSEHVLVHGDFNSSNVLVQDGEVVAVLDWEYAHSGTPYMDIGNLLRNTESQFHDAIGRGLRSGGFTLSDDWKERAAFVDIGSHVEFLTSPRSDEFKRSRVALIEEFIKMFK
jgi:aminoglycoside phosphotransferase